MIPVSKNFSCGPHRIILPELVFHALPVAPRFEISVATCVAGGESTSATARIEAAIVVSADAVTASCEPTACCCAPAPNSGAIRIFGKKPNVA